ncbi:MAG: transglycosylase SLT domain-containing protein [Actinomycetota bacterium]|nr:transglycosylase SLT domain-containing protein [Actinomycetota bacterium]
MGLSMRYPRLFIVLFVALGLTALPAADAYAVDADLYPDVSWQIETAPDIFSHASLITNPAGRERVVEMLVRRTDLDHDEAGWFLDAVAGLVAAGFLTEFLLEAEHTAMIALGPAEDSLSTGPVEQWRPLVERYFPPELVDEALSIIDCESNGDPDARNPRSNASGLFQFVDRTWGHSSEQAGFRGASAFSPEANIAAAAWLVDYSLGVGDSAWAHWTCRP